MRISKVLFLLLSLFFFHFNLSACESDENTVVVSIHTDGFGDETAWALVALDGTIYGSVDFLTYENDSVYITELCVPAGSCFVFNIYDSYGDGIVHGDGFVVTVDGVEIGRGGLDFDYETQLAFACPESSLCMNALTIEEGVYTTGFDDTWYSFTPDSTGIFLISTCNNSNSCDTKIWVYSTCQVYDDSNEGTIFYNDNNANCGDLAEVEGYFAANVPYLIRMGDASDACADNPFSFSVNYLSVISGCTDPTSCTFNPLATIDDGTCIPVGDPACPDGPDLVLRQDVLETSIYLTTFDATDQCLIDEGCLQGFGMRDIIRFTTHIENNGLTDYLIGEPIENPSQFTYDNCHNHFHYDGYAEYVLFDEEGTALPIGFKNGFCVLDLICDHGGSPKYGCSYMGITAGCGDIYDADLDCQWIDVTDVEDGFYTFVTRINWDNAPDALGRVEVETENNWAQVCIELDRSSGELEFNLVDDCPVYVDCFGEPFGNAQPDCNGVCGGITLMGDLDVNELHENADVYQYIDEIISGDMIATSCNDLNADDQITVYDAALLSDCLNYGATHSHTDGGAHDHCGFPSGLLNPADTVALSILQLNQDEQYLDIAIDNPSVGVVAYQFRVSGVSLISAESLIDPVACPISPKISLTSGMTIGLSYEDSTIAKSSNPHPLVRLYFSDYTDTLICISNIVDIVNEEYHQVVTRIDGPCLGLVNANEVYANVEVKVEPNPFNTQTHLSFYNANGETFDLSLLDAMGRVVQTYENIQGNQLTIHRKELPSGVYLFRLKSETKLGSGKLVLQ